MRHQYGRTLLELITAVAVAGVLTATAAPGLSRFVGDSRRSNAVNTLIVSVQLARSEAYKRREPVVLCPSADGRSCTGRSDWSVGWVVFLNADDDSPPVIDHGETVLAQTPATRGVTVKANRNSLTLRAVPRRSSNGTLTFCGGGEARAVIVAPNGRPRVAKTAADGSALRC